MALRRCISPRTAKEWRSCPITATRFKASKLGQSALACGAFQTITGFSWVLDRVHDGELPTFSVLAESRSGAANRVFRSTKVRIILSCKTSKST
jgi:hypothetical protein